MEKEMTEREKIAYNCRKATLLIEKKQSIRLTSREKMELKLHLAGCYICRVYQQQSVLINNMMTKFFKEAPQNIKLDSTFKDNLQKRIDDKINPHY